MFVYVCTVDSETRREEYDERDAALGRAQSDLLSGRAAPVSIELDGVEVMSAEQIASTLTPRVGADAVAARLASAGTRPKRPSHPRDDGPGKSIGRGVLNEPPED